MGADAACGPQAVATALALDISARGAAASDFAGLLCSAIEAEAGPVRDPEGMRLAVHEAVANAIQHGCLELGSDMRRTRAGHEAFAAAMLDRMATPGYGDRRIHFAADWTGDLVAISVCDNGPGYRPAAPASPTAAEAKTGRGLTIIRSLAHEVDVASDGRCITMRFLR